MFTTLRYNEDTVQLVNHIPPTRAQGRSLACKACRTCKLRCSREEGGCRRCLTKKLPCTYPSASKSRKSGARNPVTANAPASTVLDTRPSAADGHTYDSRGELIRGPTGSPVGPNRMINQQIESLNGSESSPDLTFLDDFLGYGDGSNQGTIQNPFPSVDWLTLMSMSPRESELSTFPTAAATPPPQPLYQTRQPQNLPLLDSPSSSSSSSSSSSFFSPSSSPSSSSPPASSPSSSSSPPASCACPTTIMTLLEAITIEALTGSLQSVPNTLQTTKKALTQCKSHLHCSTHTTDPSSLMLVTIICQKLIAIYQRTVTILYNQFNKIYHPNLGHVHDRDAMNAAQEKAAQVVLFGYEVAVEEEPCVFGGLVILQLGIMAAFLMKLKLKLKEEELESHLRILQIVVADVEALREMCSSPCEV